LHALPFDLPTCTVRGEAVTVVRGVDMNQLWVHAQVAVSPSGVLAYVPGGDRGIGRVVAVGRQDQKPKTLPLPAGKYGVLDLSPDDRFLAIHAGDVRDYIIIFDLKSGEWWKLSGSDGFGWPIWNGDSTTVALAGPMTYKKGKPERTLQIQAADRTALVQQTITLPYIWWLDDWHPREKILAISESVLSKVSYLRLENVSLADGPSTPTAKRWGTVFSPDGTAVASLSDESGRDEIWLNTYPPGTARQFSDEGGAEPVWSRNGEVFFRRGNEWFAARVSSGSPPTREGRPQRAFALIDFVDTPGRSYDVSSDGQTLYTVQWASTATDDKIHIVGNWFTEVRRLVPAK
jgi:Tol biopolymer transport system component